MFSETEVLSRVIGLSSDRLKACVDNGWIRASVGTVDMRFAEIDVARLQLICTLEDDMEVDRDMLPTLLALLDNIYGLRRDLRSAMRAISTQPEDVRSAILASIDTD